MPTETVFPADSKELAAESTIPVACVIFDSRSETLPRISTFNSATVDIIAVRPQDFLEDFDSGVNGDRSCRFAPVHFCDLRFSFPQQFGPTIDRPRREIHRVEWGFPLAPERRQDVRNQITDPPIFLYIPERFQLIEFDPFPEFVRGHTRFEFGDSDPERKRKPKLEPTFGITTQFPGFV